MRNKSHPFAGRSLTVINDFSVDERFYLFQKTRELMDAIRHDNNEVIDSFRIDDPGFGIYEIFLEDSTRTRESFKNAMAFHRIKGNALSVTGSSLNKAESYRDTFCTLAGYGNSIYIVRSKEEGLCKWLDESLQEYQSRNSLASTASLINAGDGKHEHPTQELLDEFTFLEDGGWNRDEFHIALVGDLFHGRTTHSKAHGLTIFKRVRVDLIAPPELAMPQEYIDAMKENGFEITVYDSIEEYVKSGKMANRWYFTRPQLERMGDQVLDKQEVLREMITFRKEYIDELPPGTHFYHPLPRHKTHPVIPPFLDGLSLNGWEKQSINGMYIRIVLLALLAGKIGDDCPVPSEDKTEPLQQNNFIHEIRLPEIPKKKNYSEGVRPLTNGIVIDHICCGESTRDIRIHIRRLIDALHLDSPGGEWISSTRGSERVSKGIIFRPNHFLLNKQELHRLAAMAPGCTVNFIKNGSIRRKIRLSLPTLIRGLPNTYCMNRGCISHPDHEEGTLPSFTRKENEDILVCAYCGKHYTFKDIHRR